MKLPAAARRFAWALVVIALAGVYFLFGHLKYWPAGVRGPHGQFELSRPVATSGDEPHYLLIINSILFDHDVRIDPDFARIQAGGYDAGIAWKGQPFGGHSILVDPRTRRHVTCPLTCDEKDAARVGAPLSELEQYPAHPVGYPAVAALFALPFRPAPPDVEALVGTFGILLSIAGVLLTYAIARKSGLATKHAVAAAVLLGFASSWLPYVRSYFSEPAIGVFLLLGFLALRMRRPVLAGIAVGVAMAMKPVFLVFGLCWIVERFLAKERREAFWLTVSIGICGVILTAFNLAVLRAPTTTGAIPFALANGLHSLKDTFFHPGQGLLLFVPWTAIPLVWGPLTARPGVVDHEGLVTVEAKRQMLPPIFLCLLTYAIVAWGPGYCYGPRYWVPLMPFLALLAIDFAIAGKAWRRVVVGALAAVSLVVALVGVTQYHLLFLRPATAGILEPAVGPPAG
jgi:hypothetical protein